MFRWSCGIASIALGAWLAGCPGGGQIADDADATGDDDSAGDDDTGDDDDATAPGGPVAGIQWRLHDEIESLVYVSWEQLEAAEVHVEYSFDEGSWHGTPAFDAAVGQHEALLLGIPYDIGVRFKVACDLGEGPVFSAEVEASTGVQPVDLPPPSLLQSEPDAWEPSGNYLLASINQYDGGWTGGRYWKFIMDRQGRVVWALETPDGNWTIYQRVALNGVDILWDEFTYWNAWDEGAGSKVHRMKIDGSILESYDTPGGHHAFVELPDGSLVYGSADWESERLDRLNADGTYDTIWDCRDYHDAIGVNQMCQSNSLFWHEPSDSFLYSFYTTEVVLEIDHASGQVVRQFGHLPGSWAFDPEDSAFWWQHGVTYTDAGTLLVSTHSLPSSEELCVREYEVDDGSQTLTEVWNFGVGAQAMGPYAGEAHRLPSGNTLHNYGSGARVREATPDGDVVWEARWGGSKLLGRTVWLEDLYDFAP
jgi:hypothetical protein